MAICEVQILSTTSGYRQLQTYITVLNLVFISVDGAGTALSDVLLHGEFAKENLSLVNASRFSKAAIRCSKLVGERQFTERSASLFRV